MKYRFNEAGNPMVDASPEDVRSMRPAIHAAFRRWRANEGDIEDFCQDVEIVVWQALAEQRVPGHRLMKPQDALLDYMFAVGWNLWRNHSRKRSVQRELLHDVMPDRVGTSPEARLDARETLLRIATRPDVARLLLAPLDGPYPERREGLAKSTFWHRREQALKWAREPPQPERPTPWKRKKKRYVELSIAPRANNNGKHITSRANLAWNRPHPSPFFFLCAGCTRVET